jgi:3-hydroxyisobutyrate dehydrogenase
LQHLLKDVRLFGAEASKAGLDTRLLEALQGVTQDAVARGLENTDYSAVYEAVLFPTASEGNGAALKAPAGVSGEAA